MAESTLSLQYSDLEALVGRFLGYGETPSAVQITDIRRCINGGARMFYNAHDWSFLHLTTTLTTGTSVDFTANSTTDTFTSSGHGMTDGQAVRVSNSGGALPAGLSATTTYYIITAAANTFQLSTTSGGSAVDITDNGTGTQSCRLYDWKYNLPDNFGRILGDLHFDLGDSYPPVRGMDLYLLMEFRNASDTTDRPKIFAIRTKTVDQTTGQRFEICMWPTPDAGYTLTYTYRINPESTLYVASTTNRPYPLGGEMHSETFLEACLAWAERFFMDQADGTHQNAFREQLAISIARDSENAPGFLGYNGDAGNIGLPFFVSDRRTDSTATYTAS